MTAEAFAVRLAGRRVGSYCMAHCPAHDDGTPSLSICGGDGGQVLVHCHAGCAQVDVIAALCDRGLWRHREPWGHRATVRAGRQPQAWQHEEHRRVGARRIWDAARPAPGTAVETYLTARGLRVALPGSLRWHSGLAHPTGGVWPVMVALVTHGQTGQPMGVHRTFLARDGHGKAPVAPPKMMLGPCRQGAVRLAAPKSGLLVGEGIETCLAAMVATGAAAWAALSTSGLRSLMLPTDVREVTALADGDDPGEAAARAAAQRWVREGRRVRIARPPRGRDFADLLTDEDARGKDGMR